MMEQLEMEQPGASNIFRATSDTDNSCVRNGRNREAGPAFGRRLIALRRYTPIVCLVELMAIALLGYLLVSRHDKPHPAGCAQSTEAQMQRPFIVDNSSGGAGNQLFLDLIEDCDQRKHDLSMSVVCRSSRIEACGPVEAPTVLAGGAGVAGDQLASVIVSSKQGDRLARRSILLKRVDCTRNPQHCRLKPRASINLLKRKQKIIGWGGALTDSSINNLLSLTTNGTRQLLQDYFGPQGLMFNLVRVTLGGSDFSARFYTNDDSPRDDLALEHFQLREEDLLYKIPTLKMIQQEFDSNAQLVERNLGPIKLFASMWSPPVWMKTNRHFNKGQLRGHIDDEPLLYPDRPPVDELYFNALAELKVRFLRAYLNESVHFWGLTVMNEPQFASQPFLDFNTMIFGREDYANYVAKYLGPKLKGSADLRNIKLMAHDDNRRFLVNFTWPILDQRRMRQFLDGVSVHGYADEAYQLMSETYERYAHLHSSRSESDSPDAGFFVLPSELCSGHLPFMAKALVGNWHRGVHYALDIIRSLQNAAAGWVDWNMALDLEGGPGWLGGRLDAAVIVDKSRDLYHKSPMFYVLGQFSRYIPPGSTRLEARLENGHFDHQLEMVTFLLPTDDANAAKLATVVLNNNPYPIELQLELHPSGGANLIYALPCPADSIQTVIYAAH